LKLELFKISELKLDPNNARKHSAKNLKAISGSFKEFDQLKNIVVDTKNVVIAGNGTVQSFIDDGKTEIWGVRSTMSDTKNKAFALADNRTAELAEWDAGTLGEQLQSLYEDGYPINDIGFEMTDIFGEEKEGAKELEEKEFSDFDNQCPKCGFEFNDEPA
jgi:ParB-like chromosome segregation protein Spo0J